MMINTVYHDICRKMKTKQMREAAAALLYEKERDRKAVRGEQVHTDILYTVCVYCMYAYMYVCAFTVHCIFALCSADDMFRILLPIADLSCVYRSIVYRMLFYRTNGVLDSIINYHYFLRCTINAILHANHCRICLSLTL
jgi:hypothetical protein